MLRPCRAFCSTTRSGQCHGHSCKSCLLSLIYSFCYYQGGSRGEGAAAAGRGAGGGGITRKSRYGRRRMADPEQAKQSTSTRIWKSMQIPPEQGVAPTGSLGNTSGRTTNAMRRAPRQAASMALPPKRRKPGAGGAPERGGLATVSAGEGAKSWLSKKPSGHAAARAVMIPWVRQTRSTILSCAAGGNLELQLMCAWRHCQKAAHACALLAHMHARRQRQQRAVCNKPH